MKDIESTQKDLNSKKNDIINISYSNIRTSSKSNINIICNYLFYCVDFCL